MWKKCEKKDPYIDSIVHQIYILLTFKVCILFLLVYIRFLTFTIYTLFFNFPSPRKLRSPTHQICGKFPVHPIIKTPRLFSTQEYILEKMKLIRFLDCFSSTVSFSISKSIIFSFQFFNLFFRCLFFWEYLWKYL